MKYTITKGEKGKLEIKVEIPKSDFVKTYAQVLGELSKDVTISGFRKGHSPLGVVEEHIGLAKILNETANLLVSKHLAKIFDKENILPLSAPNIAIDLLTKDSDFSFTAGLYQRPNIVISDWKKIKVKKFKVKDVTEDDINQSIKNIYEAWKKSHSIEASRGEHTDTENEKESNDDDEGKYIYDAHGNKLFPTKSSRSSSPETDSSLKINDEFAKAVGANDLVHLKELVKKDLETIITGQVETKFEDDLFTEILALSQIEVPDILVEDELNRILLRFNAQLDQEGLKLEKYLEDEKITIEELKNKWRDQALKNVKITLIMDEIGKSEKVIVTKEELDKALAEIDQTKMSEEQKVDLQRYIALFIFQAKTLELIKKTIVS